MARKTRTSSGTRAIDRQIDLGLTLSAARLKKLKAKGCYFDEAAADRVLTFFANFLVHIKGKWSGQPLKLEDWQAYHTRQIFGWKRPDGSRLFRTVYIEIPRKNGKSTWIAGVGLYLLTADSEMGAEIYSAANDREQAAIVFDTAAKMVKASPELRRRARPFRRSIVVYALGAAYKVLSADIKNKDGFNSHGVLFDELHAQKSRSLWDVLTTSTGSRRQPLTIAITTAGFDRHSICWEQHEYARKVAEGIFEDDEFYPIIYAAAEDADWTDPKTWRKANPNYGISVSDSYLEASYKRAHNNPAFENTFRRLHLNQWTSSETRWIPLKAWDATAGRVVPDELRGKECYGGLDLATSLDLAALNLTFPEQVERGDGYATIFRNIWRFWIPEENMAERVRRDHVPYDLWVKQGLITATPGNVIDYDFIVKDIAKIREEYQLLELAYDRWGAVKIVKELTELGLTLIPFGQGFASMSGPSQEFLRLILRGLYYHGGNPVMRWMADNAIVKQDPAGNIKPDKSKSTNRIDGVVAAIMALDRTIRHEGDTGQSIYNKRGLLSL